MKIIHLPQHRVTGLDPNDSLIPVISLPPHAMLVLHSQVPDNIKMMWGKRHKHNQSSCGFLLLLFFFLPHNGRQGCKIRSHVHNCLANVRRSHDKRRTFLFAMVTTLWENSNTANVFYWMAGGGWKINSLPLVDKEIETKLSLTAWKGHFQLEFLHIGKQCW